MLQDDDGLYAHDPDACDCDRCRFIRYDRTLTVVSIATNPLETDEQKQRFLDSWMTPLTETEGFKRFIAAEKSGSITIPPVSTRR